jgi:replication factor C large subunit
MQKEWTEKYRPKKLDDIVGNDVALQAIRRWARSWQAGTPRVKALVLRGEPGVGKTSAALALANDMGWDQIEMNASDHRNAASIKSVAGVGSANQTFSAKGEFLSSSAGKRKLVILDEADNLFGREDYGGAKAIVETVRDSGQPIVLIVNDYYELSRKAPAIKALAEKAVFKRLSRGDVVKVLGSVLDQEGIRSSPKLLERIADNANGDLRAAINDLQMMVEGRSELEIGDSGALGKRNQEKELGSVLHSVFRAKSVREARDATFDLDITPDELVVWIEENVPLELHSSAEMAAAFDSVSRADVYLGRTRMLQHYGMWAYAKELMTGGVALSRTENASPERLEYRFPGQYIVLSRSKGPRATRDALAGKLAKYYHTSRKCIKESTLPLLAATVRRDEELLVELGKKLDLDDSDIAYLLGTEPSSAKVSKIVARIRQEGSGDAEPSEVNRPRRSGAKRKFGDF